MDRAGKSHAWVTGWEMALQVVAVTGDRLCAADAAARPGWRQAWWGCGWLFWLGGDDIPPVAAGEILDALTAAVTGTR